jgi:uncharacterized repeat protein (TIGR04076 family)
MNEARQNNNQSESNGHLAEIFRAINRYYEEVTIIKVTGECPFGHKEGEKYKTTASNSDGLCGALYHAIHPCIVTLEYGGEILWGDKAGGVRALCPEAEKVQVQIKRFENENLDRHVKTNPSFRDMTGKGFPEIDNYRVFLEILNIEKSCLWGQKKGERYEIDPFNVGGICGNLYWVVYSFNQMLLTGGGMPWEGDKNIVHGTCPDPFNLVSYRLTREERV